MKKYEITDIVHPTIPFLFRIRALIDIPRYNVKVGDLGGYIEKEDNLSHDGDCWVLDNACIYGNAQVSGNAWVSGNALVYGNAWVYGEIVKVCKDMKITSDFSDKEYLTWFMSGEMT